MRAGKITKLSLDQQDARGRWSTSSSPSRASARCARTSLRVAPAVAHRRVLHRLHARQVARRRSSPARRSRSSAPPRRSPPTCVNNIMRRPYRERLRIILNELGAGVGGRAEDLNVDDPPRQPRAARDGQGARRSSAARTRCIKDLTTNADTVIGDLAGNRQDVGRFVKEAEDAATDLGRAPPRHRRGPPAAADLPARAAADDGRARRAPPTPRRPYLRDLNASAGQLERFLDDLGPFAESSRVNVRTLAKTADESRGPAIRVRASRPSPSSPSDRASARARQQPRDRPQRPRRPRPRGREGQALAGRPGLHGLRGAPALRLRPDAWPSTSSTRTATSSRSTSPPRSAATTRTPTRSSARRSSTRAHSSAASPASGPTSPASPRADPSDTGVDDPGPGADASARAVQDGTKRQRRAQATRKSKQRARPAGPQEGARPAAAAAAAARNTPARADAAERPCALASRPTPTRAERQPGQQHRRAVRRSPGPPRLPAQPMRGRAAHPSSPTPSSWAR